MNEIQQKTGKWTDTENELFLRGLHSFGWGKWSSIARMIPTRDNKQVKSHAQKVLKKLRKGNHNNNNNNFLKPAPMRKWNPKPKHDTNVLVPSRELHQQMITLTHGYGVVNLTSSSEAYKETDSEAPGSDGRVVNLHKQAAVRGYHVPDYGGMKPPLPALECQVRSQGNLDTALSTISVSLTNLKDIVGKSEQLDQHSVQKQRYAASEPPPSDLAIETPSSDRTQSSIGMVTMSTNQSPGYPAPAREGMDTRALYQHCTFGPCGGPTNYDILCGEDPSSYSHHVGNRRFRIMIRMRLHQYETYFLACTLQTFTCKAAHMHDYLESVLESFSTCHPPCRFLAKDASNGWQVMGDAYARLRIEQAFQECMTEERIVAV